MGGGGGCRGSPWPAACVDADDRPPGRHRARGRDAIRSDPRSQRQAIQAQDRPQLRARAGELHLPAAGEPEGQLASSRGHPGLRRGDARARCGAVDGAQPARSAAGDRPALDRQRRAARRSVRAPEDAGRPEQPNADRILDDRRGADRGAAGIRAGVLGAGAYSPACAAGSYAACRSTTSTSTPGSYTFVADGTTSRARSTRRRSPAPATSR